MYLSQFRIKNFHRNKKSNIIFDIFFRLFIVCNKLKNHTINNLNIDKFNTNVVDKLIDILIQITNNFRKKFVNNYKNDLTLKFIFDMFIKLQQKTTKKISQFTIANSQQSTMILNSTSHIITNVYIKITIFDKNKKLTLQKREQLLKKHLFIFFFTKSTKLYQKSLNDFQNIKHSLQ